MTSHIKADSKRNILILHPDVFRAQSKRQLDRTDVRSRFSFLVKRFWYTPQVKVLWCLFRRWCCINWLLLAMVCWQYPQECICKRQMYIYNLHQTFQLHVNYLLKLHVWLTSVLSNWRLLWALVTYKSRLEAKHSHSAPRRV
jgi:hypothetical protein